MWEVGLFWFIMGLFLGDFILFFVVSFCLGCLFDFVDVLVIFFVFLSVFLIRSRFFLFLFYCWFFICFCYFLFEFFCVLFFYFIFVVRFVVRFVVCSYDLFFGFFIFLGDALFLLSCLEFSFLFNFWKEGECFVLLVYYFRFF